MNMVKNHCAYLMGVGFSLLSTALVGSILTNSVSFAASASTATATVKIASSCTLTTTGGGNYSATVPNGTSAEIEGSTLTASCNDAGGFALYAVGYSNDTIGNNNMIGQSVNIATNTSGNDSYWAMKINPTTGNIPTIENSFNNYHIIPNTHTKVASYASSTGTGSLSVDATYKANISSTQLAGNYLGKVKYTLIHPSAGPAPVTPLAASDCPALSICYAPNADDIEGSMLSEDFQPIAASSNAGRQTKTRNDNNIVDISVNSTVLLVGYNYSRPGYGFAGWSPSYEASTAPGSTDIIYGPQATISTNPDDPGGVDVSTNGLILYPVWVASTGSMQTFSSSDCNAMSIGDITARTDTRDSNVYTIAKLPDGSTGKCWMVENLRLDNYASITPSNTQSNNGAFGGVFVGLANSERYFTNSTSANSLYSVDGINGTQIISGGGLDYRFPRYNNHNINRTLPISWKVSSSPSTQWSSYGNYYTWAAAIADTSLYSTNGQSAENTSLCPTNWRLPKGGDKSNEANNDYWSLIVIAINGGIKPAEYDSKNLPYYYASEANPINEKLRSFPFNFVYSGYIQYSSQINRGYSGHYLTSTPGSNPYSYLLYFSTTYLRPGNSSSEKQYPYSIRCLYNS